MIQISQAQPSLVPLMLAIQPAVFFQALEKGDAKAILDFQEEALDQPGFNHKELLVKLPALVESLARHHFSQEVAYRAAMLLRKMIFRVVTQSPKLIDEKVSFPFEAVSRLFAKEPSVCLEWIIIEELLKEGAKGTVDLLQGFDNICKRVLAKGLLKEQQLPELALKTQQSAKAFFQAQHDLSLMQAEVVNLLIATESEKNKRLKADLDQVDIKLKESTKQFFRDPPSNLNKEWIREVLTHHLEQSVMHYKSEILAKLKSKESFQALFQPHLSHQVPSPQHMEQALDNLSQKLQLLFKNQCEEALEKEYNDLCCPITLKMMEEPVLAEDGFSYEKKAIQEHLERSNLSPKTREPIGKTLIPNRALKMHIQALKEKQQTAFSKRKHSLESEEPTAKKPTLLSSSQKDLLEQIQRKPDFAEAYYALAKTITLEGTVKLLDGTVMTLKQLLLKAIQLDPKLAPVYCCLGLDLPQGGSIQFSNRTVITKQQLLLKAIQLDSSLAHAYCGLGDTFSQGGSIQLPDGTVMTQQQLYIKAIQLDSNYAQAYFGLGSLLLQGGSIQLPDGAVMTEQQLYLKAIQLDPKFAKAYYGLGTTLPLGGSIQLLDGTAMTQQQLYLKAIQLDSKLAPAYYNLEATLPEGGSIQLPYGTIMTKQQLLLKAIQLDPKLALAYYNLEATLTKGGSIQLSDRTIMTQQQLLLKAIQLDPKLAQAYYKLGLNLPKGGSVQLLDGTVLTQQQLFFKAIQLGYKRPAQNKKN